MAVNKKENLAEIQTKSAIQRGILLEARESFQEAVLNLRSNCDIPPRGVDQEEVLNWQRELRMKSHAWKSNEWPIWRRRIKQLEKAGKTTEAKKLNQDFNNKDPLNNFERGVDQIISTCGLSSSWRGGVRMYVISNNVSVLRSFLGPRIRVQRIGYGTELGYPELSIVIDKTTTLEDIKSLWPVVMGHQEELPEIAPQRRSARADNTHPLFALKLSREGKSHKVIAKKLNQEFEDAGYDETDIPDMLKRIRERVGK